MKDLSLKEYDEAPHIVKWLYAMAVVKQPVGGKMIDEAIERHPEYFPDEVAHRKKWASVPQNIKDEYFDELSKMHTEVYRDMPPSKGILGWADDPKGFEEWNKAWEKLRPIEKQREKELHEKYLSPFGIEFMER